ncbi:hypothetical protein C8F01DRAFT_1095856 [Mycena amicta]|nr:hypothetical protein C8F01DRAFT_1095856 [Mycena amicta]
MFKDSDGSLFNRQPKNGEGSLKTMAEMLHDKRGMKMICNPSPAARPISSLSVGWSETMMGEACSQRRKDDALWKSPSCRTDSTHLRKESVYKEFDEKLTEVPKIDYLPTLCSSSTWLLNTVPPSFALQKPAMEIRLHPTPPTHTDNPDLFLMPPPPLPNSAQFLPHPHIDAEETTHTESDVYDAARILALLRNATSLVPTSSLQPFQAEPAFAEMDPQNALRAAGFFVPPSPASNPSTSSSIPAPMQTSSSFRPTLPRRDSPFPFRSESQYADVRHRQLEVLDTRAGGWVPLTQETQQTTQLEAIVEREDEDEPMDVEAAWPAHGLQEAMLEPRQTDPPSPPNLHRTPTEPTTEAVNAGMIASNLNRECELRTSLAIEELGLPRDRPPTVFHRPIFQRPTRFNAATYTILRHYLPNDPHLQAMAEKIEEFQASAPNAERLALLRDVLAAFVRLIMRRVEEEQTQAQAEMGDGAALYWSHERLADETSAALEAVLGIASEYGVLLEKITEAIDEAHQRELSAYHHRLHTPNPGPSPLSSSLLLPLEDNSESSTNATAATNEASAMTATSGLLSTSPEDDEWEWYEVHRNNNSHSEQELLQRMADMQVALVERGENSEGVMTVTEPNDGTAQQPSSLLRADFGEYVGPIPASPPSFSFNDHVAEDVANEGLAGETVLTKRRTSHEQTFAESPSRLVLNELFEEFDQLREIGEYRSARRVFQRAFAYVLNQPFLPDDGNHDDFRDDDELQAETTPSDVNNTWSWQRPSQTAIETLDSVQRTKEEHRAQIASATPAVTPAATTAETAFVFAAWPQGTLQSTVSIVDSYALQFGSTTINPTESCTVSRPPLSPLSYPVPRQPPPTPEVPRHVLRTPRTANGPEWWDSPRINFADNNPWYQNFRPRPEVPYNPLLPLETYAQKGAFTRAPLNATTVPPLGTTSAGRPSFSLYLSDLHRNHHPYAPPDALGPQLERELTLLRCQPTVHEGVVFSALRAALYHAFDPRAMGQLLDHDSISAANGYRLAYLYDYHQRPIYVDPAREDAELKQVLFRGPHFDLVLEGRMVRNRALAFIRRAMYFLILSGADSEHAAYQWYQDHSWATRRRFYGTHPFLHPHERAMGEILWSQLVEFGYHEKADDWGKFLDVRYVCDDVLEDFLEMGWLDIVPEAGFDGYWTRQLPNLVYDETASANDTTSDNEYFDFASDNAEADSDSSGGFSYFSQTSYQQ